MIETWLWIVIIALGFILFWAHTAVVAALTWVVARPFGFVKCYNGITGEFYWVRPGDERKGINEGHTMVRRAGFLGVWARDMDIPGGIYWHKNRKGRVYAGHYPRDALVLDVKGVIEAEYGEVQRLDAQKREQMTRAEEERFKNVERQREEVNFIVSKAEQFIPTLLSRKRTQGGGGQGGGYTNR